MSTHSGQIEIDTLSQAVEGADLPESIGAFVTQCARNFGDATAVNWFETETTLSYNDLDRRSNRIALNLLAKGYRKGAHIAVMLPNSPAFLLVWFAIAKIGGVMVPVNTAYGGVELDYLLNQSDAQALVIHESFLPALAVMGNRPDLLPDSHTHVVSHKGDLGALETGGDLTEFQPGYGIFRHDLASLQYTSGTTGFPKGCMLTQDYWILLSHVGAENFGRRNISKFLFWAPFFYMDGQWLILGAMKTGGTAFLPSKMSLTRFLGWIHETGAEYCVLVKLAEGVNRTDFSTDSIKSLAASRLASFKQPRYLCYVDEFPRTPTKKIAKSRIQLSWPLDEIYDLSQDCLVNRSEWKKLLRS